MESCASQRVSTVLRGMRDMAGVFNLVSIKMHAPLCFKAFITQPRAPIGFEARHRFWNDQHSLRGMRGIAYLFYTYKENCHK